MRRFFWVGLVLLEVACTRYQYEVTPLPGEAGHYVLVQTSGKKRGPASKVYDCRSYQEPTPTPTATPSWAPTCHEVSIEGVVKK
jgi:hypothetical protein